MHRPLLIVWTLMLACGGGPRIDTIEPTEARAGATLTFTGEHLTPALQLDIARGPHRKPLRLMNQSAESLSAQLDEALATGTYTVTARENRSEWVVGTVTVWQPEDEPPCAKRYALDTDVQRVRRRVIRRLTFRDGSSREEVLPAEEIRAIQVSTQAFPGNRTCYAVSAVQRDGRVALLADDTLAGLTDRAEAIATALGVPLTHGP